MRDIYEKYVIRPFKRRATAHIAGAVLGMLLYPVSNILGSIFLFVSLGALVPTLRQFNAIKNNKKNARIIKNRAGQIKAVTDDGIEVNLPENHACLDKIQDQGDGYIIRLGVICGTLNTHSEPPKIAVANPNSDSDGG